jgi:hypothetical protein
MMSGDVSMYILTRSPVLANMERQGLSRLAGFGYNYHAAKLIPAGGTSHTEPVTACKLAGSATGCLQIF